MIKKLKAVCNAEKKRLTHFENGSNILYESKHLMYYEDMAPQWAWEYDAL